MTRNLLTLAVWTVAVAAGLSSALAQGVPQPRGLGAPTALDGSTVRIEVDGADIDIRVSRDDPASLRSSDDVLLERQGAVHRLLPAQEGQKRRARISMVVAPWQSITVIGVGLGLEAIDEVLPVDEVAPD
ncbi:MAG: hypothetical protein AAFY88_15730, partial [Acidobacteriota bacterium]